MDSDPACPQTKKIIFPLQSDLLVTTSENSNSLIEVLISELKESITRNRERLTDLEELIKQRTFTTEEKEKLVKLLRQVKADGDLRERVDCEKLESFFKIEKSDKTVSESTELEMDHKLRTSASCATANAESGPAARTISDTLHELVAKLEVIVSEITPTLPVRPRFRSRGQSFTRYHRVRTNSQLSSASSGVGFSHEFEDLDYPLSRTGSFAQPAMSPVPPLADGDQTSIELPRAIKTTSVRIQDSSLNNLVFAIDDLVTAIKNYMQVS